MHDGEGDFGRVHGALSREPYNPHVTMTPSAQSANRFIQRLSALAGRLADREIVVSSLHCDWSSFGSWVLQVQRGRAADVYGEALLANRWDTPGPEVLRVSWDGRERLLTIENAPTPPLSSPGPWTRLMDRAFDDAKDAIRFVDEHVSEWARGAG